MPKTHRLSALDSIRGIAATAVCLSHIAFFWVETAHATGPILRILRAFMMWGHPAVILFFALSGFVLMLSCRAAPDMGYWPYLVQRMFRIYPAYLVTLVIVAVTTLIVGPVAQPWMTRFMIDTMPVVDRLGIVDAAGLLFTLRSHVQLNVITWSLVHEVRFSLLFPLLAGIAVVRPALFGVGSVALYLVTLPLLGAAGLAPYYMLSDDIADSILITTHYLPCFGIGMVAAMAHDRRAPGDPGMLLPGAVMAGSLLVPRYVHDDLLLALWAAIVTSVVARHFVFAELLRWRPLVALGRLSYSLYLVHFPIVWFLFYAAAGHLGPLATSVLAVAASLAGAWVLNVAVERPCARWGRTRRTGEAPAIATG